MGPYPFPREESEMGEKLFVGNLAYGTSDQDLRELFSTVGTCVRATVLMDRATGKSRGFGFVEMSTAAEAQRAISQLNDTELQGRRISVSEARERGAAPPPRVDGPPRSFRPPRSEGSTRCAGARAPPRSPARA